MLYTLIFFLAFWAGFSVRRSSLCLVRATHEIIERKPARTLIFVMEAMAMSLSITIPAMVFFPEYISLASSYSLSIYLFSGAILYGVGAAINGSCALGTLNQIMNGRIEFMATIIGIATGFLLFLNFDWMLTIRDLKGVSDSSLNIFLFIPLIIIVWGIALLQIVRFSQKSRNNKIKKIQQYLTSPVARDFIGVSVFGFCSGALYLLLGRSWDYTKFIMEIEEHLYGGYTPDISVLPTFITTLALISGMAVAAILSKSFKFRRAKVSAFIIKFIAGGLMGAAVGLIPGGNDTIILHGIPGLAFHAPVALMVMMMAIATFLSIQKRL